MWWLLLITIPFLLQVSKTDPSPKREAPTMILFNVVFALRVSEYKWLKSMGGSGRRVQGE